MTSEYKTVFFFYGNAECEIRFYSREYVRRTHTGNRNRTFEINKVIFFPFFVVVTDRSIRSRLMTISKFMMTWKF